MTKHYGQHAICAACDSRATKNHNRTISAARAFATRNGLDPESEAIMRAAGTIHQAMLEGLSDAEIIKKLK